MYIRTDAQIENFKNKIPPPFFDFYIRRITYIILVTFSTSQSVVFDCLITFDAVSIIGFVRKLEEKAIPTAPKFVVFRNDDFSIRRADRLN